MHEWVKLLKHAAANEPADAPLVMTLATLSRNGSPRARCVICRAIDDDGTIWITSDLRSKKNQQVALDRRVEAVLWLAKSRQQFRVRGEARIVEASDPRAIEFWKQLTDATRATFTWPAPGEPRTASDDAFAKSLPPDSPPPANFQSIAIHASFVESLDLTTHPHRRQRWRRKGGWRAEQINP